MQELERPTLSEELATRFPAVGTPDWLVAVIGAMRWLHAEDQRTRGLNYPVASTPKAGHLWKVLGDERIKALPGPWPTMDEFHSLIQVSRNLLAREYAAFRRIADLEKALNAFDRSRSTPLETLVEDVCIFF